MVHPNYPNGENSLGLWDFFGQNPTRNEQFTRAMMAIDSLGANAMVEDGPFARFSRVLMWVVGAAASPTKFFLQRAEGG